MHSLFICVWTCLLYIFIKPFSLSLSLLLHPRVSCLYWTRTHSIAQPANIRAIHSPLMSYAAQLRIFIVDPTLVVSFCLPLSLSVFYDFSFFFCY